LSSISIILLGSTFGLILRILIQNHFKKIIGFDIQNTSIIEFNEESLKVNSLDIINLAKSEGLHSHANSVEIRFED